MSKNPKIQVFILTYNRPQFIMQAVESALQQDYDDYEVIVSDNSTNVETHKIFLKFTDPRLKYIKRTPSVPVIDHFNNVLKEVKSDFFMLFHDDDEMLQNHISVLYEKLQINRNCVAAGSNAIIRGKIFRRSFIDIHQDDFLLKNKDDVAKLYLQNCYIPFASYMYRKVVAEKIRLDLASAGKNSDVSFFMNISNLGNLLVTPMPLMITFFHPGQDSAIDVYPSSFWLVNYILQHTHYSRNSSDVIKFRVRCLYVDLCIKMKGNGVSLCTKWSLRKVLIIFKRSSFDLFPKLIIKRIMLSLNMKFN